MTIFIKVIRVFWLLFVACGILMAVVELLDLCEYTSSAILLILRNPILRAVAASSNLPQLVDYIVRKISKEEVEL